MLLFFLSLLVSSKLKIDECQIRLPFRIEGSKSKPYCIQTSYYPNVEFEILNPEIATIEYTKTIGSQTIVKIVVEHTGPDTAATILIARWHDEILSIPVYVDKIDRIEIRSVLDVLYVKSYCMFKLFAYNEAGLYFNSLDGVDVDWSPDSKDESTPFNVVDVSNSPFKTETSSLPNSIIIIHPTEVAKVILRAKLVNRNVPEAQRPLQFVNPIIFHPNFYCLYPGSTAQLSLYQAKIDENNQPVFDSEDKKIQLGKDHFVVKSSKESVASVDEFGFVRANELGLADIMARDEVMILSEAHAIIRVTYPTSGLWPEQWIKVVPEKPEKYFPGPYEPDFSKISLFFSNSIPISVPDNLQWKFVNQNYKELGDHDVVATLQECNFSVSSLVHTCRKPQVEEPKIKKIRIPLNHNGYQINVLYGSGFFNFTVEDPSVITLTPDNKVVTHKIGKTTVYINDTKLPGYWTKLKVSVQELTNLEFAVTQNELYVNDQVKYDFHGTSYKNGKVKAFDYVMPSNVEIEDESIINKNLIAKKKGFTKLRICVDNVCSKFVKMNVFHPLSVQSVIYGTTHKFLNLNRNGGPVVWPNGTQTNIISCGAPAELGPENDSVQFTTGYSGNCTLTVQNDPSEENPNPIKAEVLFTIASTAIHRLGLFCYDTRSINKPECNFIPLKVPNDEILYPPNEIYIPLNHTLSTKLYAFSSDDKSLGEFSSSLIRYDVETENGEHLEYQPSMIANENFVITVSDITNSLPPFYLKVNVVKPHYVPEEDSTIVLYHKDQKPHVVGILDGSGQFSFQGIAANLEQRNLSVLPSSEVFRTIAIYDKCIPENIFQVNVTTERIDSLLIEGPDYAVIGQELEFKTTLFGPSHMKISGHSWQQVQWTSAPKELFNDHDNVWKITATKVGPLKIDIGADDIHASHSVMVFDKMSFPQGEIEIFVGDTIPLKVVGGPEKGIIYTSSDPSIVDIDHSNNAIGLKPGTVSITATVPDHLEMGNASITIHVIQIEKLVLEQSIDKMYVGSFVHIIPLYYTNRGIKPVPEVNWTVSGNDQWEKLYDSSLMVQGEKEGLITLTAVTPQKFSESKNLYFDYKLTIKSPVDLSIPLGSSYQIEIENNLPVNYTIIPITNGLSSEANTVNNNGLLKTKQEGKFMIMIAYNDQWSAIHVTVTKPPKLYLQSLSPSVVKPRLLDSYGQEYSTRNDIKFDFNISFDCTQTNDTFLFSVPTNITGPVYTGCSAKNEPYYDVSHTTLLFPRILIHPQSPVLLDGSSIQFVCYSSKPEWSSSNDGVISISPNGEANAAKPGKSVISCSPDTKTSVTVVRLQGITLKEDGSFVYRINPSISGSVDTSSLIYPSDISYRCEWDAHECGLAVHDIVQTNSSQKEHICRLELFEKRLCPAHSTLKVAVDSVLANAHHEASTEVKLNTDTFGVSSTIVRYISKRKPFVEIVIKPKPDEVSVEHETGLHVEFTNEGNVNISIDDAFGETGDVMLEHKVTGERIRITIIRDTFNFNRFFVNSNTKLLIVCIVLLVFLMMYMTYQIGKGGFLVPISPTPGGK